MRELLWIFPALVAIALVLGACRATTLARIGREAGLSFVRLVLGIAVVCAVLQLVLFLVVRIL